MPGRPSGLAVLAALAAVSLAAAGCGKSDQQQVRDTLKRYEQATARQDYDALCNKVLARALIDRLAQVGLPCDQALRIGLGSVRFRRLQVIAWKISSLSGAQPPAPSGQNRSGD